MPDEAAIVEEAATAARDVILSRFDRSTIADLDITVTYTDGQLTIDVFLETEEGNPDRERSAAADAATAAQAAVDRLHAEG